jgi:hypothetical protein
MKAAYIQGVGLAAPGLADWPGARAVLCGAAPYRYAPLPAFQTARLPRNEARRMGASVKLAFRVAEQASGAHDMAAVSAVFASATADLAIADRNCIAVTSPEHAVSPTQFHNSVHNAAAGYWSIATRSHAPATSLSGGRDSFAVALCEAWSMLARDANPVLLVCFDAVGSGLLQQARYDIQDSLALALLLSSQEPGALASLTRPAFVAEPPTPMADPALERFRQHNPAARGLPLLAALTRPGAHRITVESGQGNLGIEMLCRA